MAALTRPTQATYEVHENISVDTQGTYDQEAVVSRCNLNWLCLLKPPLTVSYTVYSFYYYR